jgi:hypothetical protein
MATQQRLLFRNSIIQTQKNFWKYLNTDIVNNLIHLFDNKIQESNEKIIKYIKDEREARGLDSSGIVIESSVYGQDDSNSSLLVEIKKNGIPILHLSIHLCPKSFKPKDAGLIHMFKNFYKTVNPIPTKKSLYALISVQIPNNKQKSLKFSIANGYTTPGATNSHLYDPEIQQEMDVIITVLNNIFDEENEKMYIGNMLVPIHNLTNTVLININSFKQHIKRNNNGKLISPQFNTVSPIYNHKNHTHIKKVKTIINKKRMTRKKY